MFFARTFGIHRQFELFIPVEGPASVAHRVVPIAGTFAMTRDPEIAVVLSASASYPLADSSVSHDAEQKDAP
jgi:hypothetical protein